MKLFLRNIKIILILFLVVSIALLGGLFYQQHRSVTILLSSAGESKNAMRSRYVNAGQIVSQDGVLLAHTVDGQRAYADNPTLARAVLHIVGDYTHNMANTVENMYQGTLLGSDRNLFKQLFYDAMGKGLGGDNIRLTINSDMSLKALELLGDRKGAIVLVNYATGEILTSVSTPTTDPINVIDFENIPDTALFNRALNSTYFPGSTLKVMTSAAWMESDAYDPNLVVTCLSPHPLIEPDGVRENNDYTHGDVDHYHAFATSCNYFFGTVGIRMGDEWFMREAEKFGFNSRLPVGQLQSTAPYIAMPLDSDAQLSWMAIGQPQGENELTASPLYLAMMTGAVANNGLMMEPQIVANKQNVMGQDYDMLKPTDLRQVMDGATSKELRAIMERNISENYPDITVDGYRIGGKTGTAEVEGQEYNNRLIVGYINDVAHPYAACIVLEDSPSAASDLLGPLFRAALETEP